MDALATFVGLGVLWAMTVYVRRARAREKVGSTRPSASWTPSSDRS